MQAVRGWTKRQACSQAVFYLGLSISINIPLQKLIPEFAAGIIGCNQFFKIFHFFIIGFQRFGGHGEQFTPVRSCLEGRQFFFYQG